MTLPTPDLFGVAFTNMIKRSAGLSPVNLRAVSQDRALREQCLQRISLF